MKILKHFQSWNWWLNTIVFWPMKQISSFLSWEYNKKILHHFAGVDPQFVCGFYPEFSPPLRRVDALFACGSYWVLNETDPFWLDSWVKIQNQSGIRLTKCLFLRFSNESWVEIPILSCLRLTRFLFSKFSSVMIVLQFDGKIYTIVFWIQRNDRALICRKKIIR